MRPDARFRLAAFILCALLLPSFLFAEPPALEVRFVTDEAEAVLAILAKRAKGEAVTDADWRGLFATEGYRRLDDLMKTVGRP